MCLTQQGLKADQNIVKYVGVGSVAILGNTADDQVAVGIVVFTQVKQLLTAQGLIFEGLGGDVGDLFTAVHTRF